MTLCVWVKTDLAKPNKLWRRTGREPWMLTLVSHDFDWYTVRLKANGNHPVTVGMELPDGLPARLLAVGLWVRGGTGVDLVPFTDAGEAGRISRRSRSPNTPVDQVVGFDQTLFKSKFGRPRPDLPGRESGEHVAAAAARLASRPWPLTADPGVVDASVVREVEPPAEPPVEPPAEPAQVPAPVEPAPKKAAADGIPVGAAGVEKKTEGRVNYARYNRHTRGKPLVYRADGSSPATAYVRLDVKSAEATGWKQDDRVSLWFVPNHRVLIIRPVTPGQQGFRVVRVVKTGELLVAFCARHAPWLTRFTGNVEISPLAVGPEEVRLCLPPEVIRTA